MKEPAQGVNGLVRVLRIWLDILASANLGIADSCMLFIVVLTEVVLTLECHGRMCRLVV